MPNIPSSRKIYEGNENPVSLSNAGLLCNWNCIKVSFFFPLPSSESNTVRSRLLACRYYSGSTRKAILGSDNLNLGILKRQKGGTELVISA